MTIPGFAAETALQRSGRRYVTTATGAAGAKADVSPQLVRRPTEEGCIRGCICVSPINCPCCNSFPWPWPWGDNNAQTGIL